MDKNEVNIAFEILLEEIEDVIDALNLEGEQAFKKQDYEKAKKVIENATRLTSFREKVRELQRWENTAQWCRNTLVQEGLLSSDSPRGIWEITAEGEKLLREKNRLEKARRV